MKVRGRELEEYAIAGLEAEGYDCRDIEAANLQVEGQCNSIIVRYGDVEVTLPAPSQEAIDSGWEEYGGYIISALVGGVLLGVGVLAGHRLSSGHMA